jgi:hypothetical protein
MISFLILINYDILIINYYHIIYHIIIHHIVLYITINIILLLLIIIKLLFSLSILYDYFKREI